MLIEDGSGRGYIAKVNSDNYLHTYSLSESVMGFTSRNSKKAFILATDFVSVSNTSIFNGLVYIKYTGEKILHLERVRVCGDFSGTMQIKMLKNPTAGTLISGATDANIKNANLTSAIGFPGLAYVGASGSTVTDGELLSNFTNKAPGHSIQTYSGALILGNGNSIAMVAKPSAAGNICMEVLAYEAEEQY